jgi:hypothetical protein
MRWVLRYRRCSAVERLSVRAAAQSEPPRAAVAFSEDSSGLAARPEARLLAV